MTTSTLAKYVFVPLSPTVALYGQANFLTPAQWTHSWELRSFRAVPTGPQPQVQVRTATLRREQDHFHHFRKRLVAVANQTDSLEATTVAS